jgi:hypothetical protein
MKANSPSSSLETKSSGCAASTIGFFVERLGGENGVARSAGMLPHNGSRSDVRAGGNVPHMIIDEPAIKSKWSSTNKGFCNYGGWRRLAEVGCILAIQIHAVRCLDIAKQHSREPAPIILLWRWTTPPRPRGKMSTPEGWSRSSSKSVPSWRDMNPADREDTVHRDLARRLESVCKELSTVDFEALVAKMTTEQLRGERLPDRWTRAS